MLLNTKKCFVFVDYWERIKAYWEDMRKSPLRLLAVVILAIIIFSLLIVMVFLVLPKEKLHVECLQVNGRNGNLFTIESNEQHVSLNVVVEVRDSDNASVEKASVTLSDGEGKAKGETDAQGKVTISLDAILPLGEQMIPFKVKVEKNGFSTYVEHNFVIVARA